MKRKIIGVICAVLFFSSCQNPYKGLGTALDLEAPVVAVTSHKNMDYVGPYFTLKGITTDNIKTTSVVAKISGVGLSLSFNATILDSGDWSVDLSGDDSGNATKGLPDGEYQVRVTASDNAGNADNKSVASLTVVVDATSPSALISEPALKPLTTLQTIWPLNVRDFDSVDLVKNGIIRIRGISEENFRLSSLIVEIIHDAEVVAIRSLSQYQPTDSDMEGTIWNWLWNLDTTKLTVGGLPLTSGQRYYFKVRVTLRDMNPENPATILEAQGPGDPGYFMVYQDGDQPWSQVQSHSSGETLQPRSILSGNAWDDDGLKGIYARIQKASDTPPDPDAYLAWVAADLADGKTKIISFVGNSPRMYTWNIQAPDNPGAYKLYLRTLDKNNVSDSSYQVLDVSVADQNSPMTVVSSPENQAVVPSTGKGDFTLTGYSYDNNNVSEMKMAWVPKGVSASELLAGNHWNLASGATPVTLTDSGIKIWDLTSKLAYDSSTSVLGTRLVWNWSATFNVENDFVVAGKTEYADRQLIFYTRDTASNATYTRLTLAGEREAPTGLSITFPLKDGDFLRAFGGEYNEITGTVSDNSRIASLTIKWVEGNVTKIITPPTDQESSWNWSISSEEFALDPTRAANFEKGNNLQLVVEDVYGNKAFSSRYLVVDSAVPVVTRVTSTEPNGYYGVGKALDIAVEFSKPVNVTGTGTATLTLNSGGVATYVSGTGTASLVFRYTVGAWQNIEILNYSGISGLTKSDTLFMRDSAGNDAVLTLPDTTSSAALGQIKSIIIDTLAPGVQEIFTTHTKLHNGAGVGIVINIRFSEKIIVSGNSPTLDLNSGGLAVYSSGSGTDTLKFNYIVESGDGANPLEVGSGSPLQGDIKDISGNIANLTIGTSSTLGSKGLVIDTLKPGVPIISGISAGSYKVSQSLTLSGIADSLLEYTTDGTSWQTYDSPVALSADGSYTIRARQTDLAGNRSDETSPILISIDTQAPAAPFISGITAGNFITDQSFRIFGETNATIQYRMVKNTVVNVPEWVTVSSGSLVTPTILDGEEADFVISARQVDAAGNLGSESSAISYRVDKKKPQLSGVAFSNKVTGSLIPDINKDIATDSNIIFNFSEPVYKENGTITLNRVDNSNTPYKAVPVILSVSLFNEYQNRFTGDADLGTFYQLTTNGTTGGIPNTEPVYVLKWGTVPSNTTLADQFDTFGYNQIVFDIQSTQISGHGTNQLTLNPSIDFPKGSDWKITISADSLRDAAGNKIATLSNNYFTTGPVATPVIRIQKQSGKWASVSGVQPKQTNYDVFSETPGVSLSGNTGGTIGIDDYNAGIFPLSATATRLDLTSSDTATEKAYKTILGINTTLISPNQVWFRGSNNGGGPTTAPGFPLRWEEDQYTHILPGTTVSTETLFVTWEVTTTTYFKPLKGNADPGDGLGPTQWQWKNLTNITAQPGEKTVGVFGAWETEIRTRTSNYVSSPVFSVASGSSVIYGNQVTVTSGTAGSTIYYTTDGSTPTTSSTSGPAGSAAASVVITADTTLKAFALKAGMTDSFVSTAEYTLGTYSRIVNLDGTNDFNTSYEEFSGTTAGSKGYVTWDSNNIYVGLYSNDLQDTSATEWVQIYVGGTQSGPGIGYSGVQPNFSTLTNFNPAYHYRFKTDGSYINRQTYNGSAWVDFGSPSWSFNTSNKFAEIKIPRADIGNPTELRIVMFMLDEGAIKKLWSGVPSVAFTDVTSGAGNVNFSRYMRFDLTSKIAPSVQVQLLP